MAKSGNRALGEAKRQKKDEFYTQLGDINAELGHYTRHFKGKVVFCNCDDPYESTFFKYFAANFNALGLKRLIATCYAGSPVAGRQLELDFGSGFNAETQSRREGMEEKGDGVRGAPNAFPRIPHKIIINEVTDVNGDGRIDLSDVEWLIKNDKNVLSRLEGDGDFRSAECVELLKQSDVVVTNPPFSLFREYVAQLIQYDKKFLIIGNVNAVKYKELFPLIMQNTLWLGASIHSGDRKFTVPENYTLDAAACGIDENGQKFIRVKGVRWFTNLDYKQRHEELVSVRRYNPDDYPKYVNYDAIEISKTSDIPEDWDGMMGVPITFLDKYNPDQFEIIGQSLRLANMDVIKERLGRNDGGPTFYIEREGKLLRLYDRIVIRRRK